MTAEPIIRLDRVHKSYGSIKALHTISLEIAAGEFFTLVGPSGCGKTTLLRLLAGFEVPNGGTVMIDSMNMAGVPANRRPTNMVFQNYAVFPHMNVADNIAYGLRAHRVEPGMMAKRTEDALAMVGLAGLGQRYPSALSGGQRQRVALARALVLQPRVLLLDEPMSALDKKLREQMQMELRSLQRAVGITFVLVTHDQEEALILSDRIAVMFDGRIAQLATPHDLYQRPQSRTVAEFIGVMNFLYARNINTTPKGISLEIEGLGHATIPNAQAPDGLGATPIVGIRPEMLSILENDAETAGRSCPGTIVDVQYYGDMTYYDAQIDGTQRTVTIAMRNTAGHHTLARGESVRIGWSSESILLLN